MSCLGDCWEVGPPPDTILFLPPPPAPSFLQQQQQLLRLRDNSSSILQACAAAASSVSVLLFQQPCSSWTGGPTSPPKVFVSSNVGVVPGPPPRQQESPGDLWASTDAWLLVVVASSVGVLLLGALLALLLLRCREGRRRQDKQHVGAHVQQRKLQRGPELWAALSPRGGTHHFVSAGGGSTVSAGIGIGAPFYEEHHYETIGVHPDYHYQRTVGFRHQSQPSQPPPPPPPPPQTVYRQQCKSFDNCGFGDYEEPTPLTQLDHQDMRCISTLRRPRVSPPQRIEHPNLPPLNLNPLPAPVMRKSAAATLTRRPSDAPTILKYNIN